MLLMIRFQQCTRQTRRYHGYKYQPITSHQRSIMESLRPKKNCNSRQLDGHRVNSSDDTCVVKAFTNIPPCSFDPGELLEVRKRTQSIGIPQQKSSCNGCSKAYGFMVHFLVERLSMCYSDGLAVDSRIKFREWAFVNALQRFPSLHVALGVASKMKTQTKSIECSDALVTDAFAFSCCPRAAGAG